jgi:hypothetical protein
MVYIHVHLVSSVNDVRDSSVKRWPQAEWPSFDTWKGKSSLSSPPRPVYYTAYRAPCSLGIGAFHPERRDNHFHLLLRFPPRRPGFEPGSGHVGFVVNKVAQGQVFSEYFAFPCQSSFYHLLHNHHHLSSGANTIGQWWPQYQVDSVSPH